MIRTRTQLAQNVEKKKTGTRLSLVVKWKQRLHNTHVPSHIHTDTYIHTHCQLITSINWIVLNWRRTTQWKSCWQLLLAFNNPITWCMLGLCIHEYPSLTGNRSYTKAKSQIPKRFYVSLCGCKVAVGPVSAPGCQLPIKHRLVQCAASASASMTLFMSLCNRILINLFAVSLTLAIVVVVVFVSPF